MNNIKVLYILDYGTIGGATRSFMELVQQMKNMGVEPIVVTGMLGDFNVKLDIMGVKNIAAGHYTILEPLGYNPIKYLKKWVRYYISEYMAIRKLSNSVDFSQIDLIHTNSARNSIGCRLSKKYGIPHIMHIREFADADFDCKPLSPYKYLFNQYSNCFIAISEAVKNHWVRKGLMFEKMRVIYNGIHYEDISVSSDESKKAQDLKLVIVGGVCRPKGQDLAIEAIRILPEDIRCHLTLDVIGWYDSCYQTELQLKSTRYGLNVNFYGSRNDVHENLGIYQIGLMCSRSEGFGRSTAEYMHARLGVISSDSGANPELVTDGECGLLFKNGDPKSLSDCILKFYNNRNLLIKCSQEAQRKARSCYTDDLNAKNIYKLYREVLNTK